MNSKEQVREQLRLQDECRAKINASFPVSPFNRPRIKPNIPLSISNAIIVLSIILVMIAGLIA